MAHYELPDRLADGEQQSTIASIIGIPNTALTNTDLIPRPPGGGAGRVNKFRRSNVQEYLDPNQVSASTSPGANSIPSEGSGQELAPERQMNHISSSTANEQQTNIELAEIRREGARPTVQPRTGGYSSLSSFMSSDKVFSIFRRFDSLSTRNLLFLQDELCELEEKLVEIDKADLESGTHAKLVSLHSRRHDSNDIRKAIMLQLRIKIGEYQTALDQHSRTLAFPKPAGIYADSLVNWIDGMKPVVEAESHFLDAPRDLVSLAPVGEGEGHGVLENWVEKRWSHFFSTKKHRQRPHAQQNSHVHYYSQTTIRRVVRSALTVIAVVILVAPIFALYYIQNSVVKLALIGVFSFCFAISLALWTKSSNHEIFAAMAAYCAVLVVFIGNLPN